MSAIADGRVSGVHTTVASGDEKTRPSATPAALVTTGASSPVAAPSSLNSGAPATMDIGERAPSRPDAIETSGEVTMRSGHAPRWIAGAALLVTLGGFLTLVQKGHLESPFGTTAHRSSSPAAPASEKPTSPSQRPSGDGVVQTAFVDRTATKANAPAAMNTPIAALRPPIAAAPVDASKGKLTRSVSENPPGAQPSSKEETPKETVAESANGESTPAQGSSSPSVGDMDHATPPAAEPREETGSQSPETAADAEASEDAVPPPPAPPFNKIAAATAMAAAVGRAQSCRKPNDPAGVARVTVTFAPSGRVTTATVAGAPYAGTETGGCIANGFRGVMVPEFSGDAVTVTKSIPID